MGGNRSFDELERIENKRYAELRTIQSEHDALEQALDDAWESGSDERIKELLDRIDESGKQESVAYDAWCDAQKNMLDRILDEITGDMNQDLDDEAG